jgi:hypothetical protein
VCACFRVQRKTASNGFQYQFTTRKTLEKHNGSSGCTHSIACTPMHTHRLACQYGLGGSQSSLASAEKITKKSSSHDRWDKSVVQIVGKSSSYDRWKISSYDDLLGALVYYACIMRACMHASCCCLMMRGQCRKKSAVTTFWELLCVHHHDCMSSFPC